MSNALGMNRFWIMNPAHRVVAMSNNPNTPYNWPAPFEVIDRGLVNTWTGKPFPTS